MSTGTHLVTEKPPSLGLPVKLKHGMLTLSAKQIQRVTQVRKLEPGDEHMNASEIIEEGGYWIKTTHTDNEWWAWSLFRIA